MIQSTEFDVNHDFEAIRHSLRDQVSLACDHAELFNSFEEFMESFYLVQQK